MRILVISAEAVIGHEYRNLPLSKELLSRGHEVIHTGPSGAMSNQGFTGSTYPPETETISEFKSVNTRLFNSRDDLLDLVDWSNLIILGIGKGYEGVAEYANKTTKPVILMRDVGADHMWPVHCELAAVRGRFETEHTVRRLNLSPDRVKVTGCQQYDEAAERNSKLNKSEFIKKYGLDPESKIVVISPGSPASHTRSFRTLFPKACYLINKIPGFQVIISPHPKEYANVKMDHIYENTEISASEQNAPGIPIVEKGDKYEAYRYCELIIATHFSALSRETALFHKPLIFLQNIDAIVDILSLDPSHIKKYFPDKLFKSIKRNPFHPFIDATDPLNRVPGISENPEWNLSTDTYKKLYGGKTLEYIGGCCYLSELKNIIESYAYRYNDIGAYDSLTEEYSFANDGNSYIRVADMVENALSNREISKMLADQTNVLKIAPILIKLIRKASRLLP